MELINTLRQGLQQLKIDLPISDQTKILDYLKLLEKWNKVYNLTAINNIEQMLPKHVFDSLAILPYVRGERILDVGTGAGLPGLLLAIASPNWQYVLLDSNAKKIRFIKQAIIELNIKNVTAICIRTEDLELEEFNTVISRAYANIHLFYTHTVKFINKNGCLLAMKGMYPETEITTMKQLPVNITTTVLQIPQLSAQRHLIEITLE
ncbi:MAG: 16S rRNA (guanine(527)-N(7))-methyltransferase RsmG [Candidatus Marithrix sp.]